jgi:hypothetical protein
MRNRLLVLISVVLAVGLLASCGSSEKKVSAKAKPYAAAYAKQFSDKEKGVGLTKKQGTCVGDAIMKVLGAEPFTKAKVKPSEIGGTQTTGQLLGKYAPSDKDAEEIADGWQECVDLPKLLATQLAPQFKLSTKARTCLQDDMDKGDLAKRQIEASFTKPSKTESAKVITDLYELVQSCTAVKGKGGYFVDSMTASLTSSGKVTADQAKCVAQSVVDELGTKKLAEISVTGAQGSASTSLQNAFATAVQKAGKACNIPDELLQGG